MAQRYEAQMQIRLSKHLYDEVKRIAGLSGNTINGTIGNLMLLGLRMYNAELILHPKQEE